MCRVIYRVYGFPKIRGPFKGDARGYMGSRL